MKKRLFAIALCFCMALSLLPMGAFAAEGGTKVSTLDALTNALNNDGTIVLDANISTTSFISVKKNVKLDLNGHKLSRTEKTVIGPESNGSLTITDSSSDKTGSIESGGTAVWVDPECTLILESGTLKGTSYGVICQGNFTMTGGALNSSNAQALDISGNAVVNISGGTITSDSYAICLFGNSTLNFSGEASATSKDAAAISTNGSKEGDTNYANGATVNISGGTLTSTNDGAVYAPAGIFNVTDGTMTGKTAFYAKGGKITISGGTFIGNGEKTAFEHSGNGWNNTGDALVVESCDYPYSPATITVSGGNFKSKYAEAVAAYAYGNDKGGNQNTPANGFLSGGYFSTVPNEKYVATGYQVVENDGTNSKAPKTDYPYMIGMEKGAEEAAKEVAVTPATASADPDVTVSATENKEKAEAAAQSVTGADKVSTTDVQKDNDKNTAKGKLIENNLVSFSATKGSDGKWTYSLAEDTAIYVVYETYFVVDAKEYDTTNKTITLDIKPKCDVIAVVGGTNAPTADQIDESNSVTLETRDVTVNEPVEISIDVTGLFTAGDTVWVKHTTEAGKTFLYEGAVKDESGKQILTFTNPDGFSTFEIGGTGPVASLWAKDATKVTHQYASIKDAFDDASEGCTVYILGTDTNLAAGTKITVSKPMTVDVSKKSDDYDNIGTYLVADDTKVVMEKNAAAYQYLFTKKDTESGTSGGGGTTTYKVNPPASVDNGTVTVNPQNAAKGKTVTITPKPDEGYKVDAVTVTDKDGKPVTVKDNGDGTYSFTMPASAVDVAVSFAKDETQPTTNEKFVDVPKDAYYHDAVYWAVDKGITEGVDATHFAPDATCTRAQMVTFLWRDAGQPAPTSSENPFTDVKEGAYYYDAVLWAVEKGITVGTSSTTFSPDDTVIRGQAVTFLWRYEGKPAPTATENPFTDVTSSDYFYQPVLWAVEKNVTAGTSKTTFSPKANCLRSQVVTFLYRAAGQE